MLVWECERVRGWHRVGTGRGGRGAGRVRRGGLLTKLASAPETHLKDIWDWGISGEHGGKVIVNKGEHVGRARARPAGDGGDCHHPGAGAGLSHREQLSHFCHQVSGLKSPWQKEGEGNPAVGLLQSRARTGEGCGMGCGAAASQRGVWGRALQLQDGLVAGEAERVKPEMSPLSNR